MKKLLLSSFILFCLQLAPSKAQWVTIPDASFVTFLTQQYPSCMSGNQMNTSCTQIINDTILNISFTNISNLTGIEHFINLTELMCSDNQLTFLPPLPSNLKQFGCQNNQLTSLPPLPSSLILLWCDDNQLTSLPAIPASLQVLFCQNNQLTYLPALPDSMTTFYIDNNNISCLNNLPYVSNFSSASISNNPLTCVPNYTSYSLGLPFCMDNDSINNPNNCQSANITGYVFTDLNSDCQFNITDLPAENIPVKLYDSQNNLLSTCYTVNGIYSFSTLQPDSFHVKIDDNILPLNIACAVTNNQIAILDSSNQTLQAINFPVVCDSAYDIRIQSINHQGFAFPGQTHTLITNIITDESWYNLNCGSINNSGSIVIQITGPVTYISPAPIALTPLVFGNTFTYNVLDFNSLTPSSFGLVLITDTTAVAGNQICVHVEITLITIDADTTNNHYDFCYQVVNSYDPNKKEVFPLNVLPEYNDWFTYTIHFQNTGNAPAINIRLRDTLDTQLDLNTFEVLGFSHDAITAITGNILTIKFNNIMLPDSTTDNQGSKGYFQYRIKPLYNLPLGTQIENTAFIYFDYNVPIITNTTENNFQITGIKDETSFMKTIVIYPNPSNGVFNFMDNRNLKTVEVFNLLGEQIISQTNQEQIDLSKYSKGIYFAKVNGNAVIKLIRE